MLLPPHREPCERHLPGIVHRAGKEAIGARGGRLASEQVRIVEIHGIDLIDGNELTDLDGVVAAGLKLLYLLVGKGHVAALFDLVAADQLAAIDDRVVDRAIDLLLNAAFVLGVEQVEADRLRRGGREQTHRNRDEPEGDAGTGYRSRRHGESLRCERPVERYAPNCIKLWGEGSTGSGVVSKESDASRSIS